MSQSVAPPELGLKFLVLCGATSAWQDDVQICVAYIKDEQTRLCAARFFVVALRT